MKLSRVSGQLVGYPTAIDVVNDVDLSEGFQITASAEARLKEKLAWSGATDLEFEFYLAIGKKEDSSVFWEISYSSPEVQSGTIASVVGCARGTIDFDTQPLPTFNEMPR